MVSHSIDTWFSTYPLHLLPPPPPHAVIMATSAQVPPHVLQTAPPSPPSVLQAHPHTTAANQGEQVAAYHQPSYCDKNLVSRFRLIAGDLCIMTDKSRSLLKTEQHTCTGHELEVGNSDGSGGMLLAVRNVCVCVCVCVCE